MKQIRPKSAEMRIVGGYPEVVSLTAGLRFHDLRHHAITELVESKASDQHQRNACTLPTCKTDGYDTNNRGMFRLKEPCVPSTG